MEVKQDEAVPATTEVAQTKTTSQIWVFGSGECDQLGIEFGEDDIMEIKRAKKIELFNNDGQGAVIPQSLIEKVPISQLMCGGMHSVVLTPQGIAYSWGCNDDGALGRQGGNDFLPERVMLPNAINGMSLGGSHSIFYNTELQNAFFCGIYRNAVQGKVGEVIKLPTEFGRDVFCKGKRRLTKIVSGLDHSVALTNDMKVWAWGDAESGKIGRMLKGRNAHNQSRKIEQVGAKKAVNIWCGGHSSFYINDKGQLFGWGLNNHGQLGIGHKENVCNPTRVYWNEPEEVTQVAGGEHHTIALTKSGRVYNWGRNDEGECGVGDLFGKYRREQALLKQQQEEEAERKAKEEADAAAAGVELAAPEKEEAAAKEAAEALLTASQATKKSRKSSKASKQEAEPDLYGIYYFSIPNCVASLSEKAISKVFAQGHYNYALSEATNEVYAWGMGENYVLGTRDDENEFEPKLVHPKQFMENRVKHVGLGVQHVIVLSTAEQEPTSSLPPLDQAARTQKFDLPKKEDKKEEEIKPEEEVKGESVPAKEVAPESKQAVETQQVVETAAGVAEQKVLSQKSEPKARSRGMSQSSGGSRKRKVADFEQRKKDLESVPATIPEEEENEKRGKGQ